MKWITISLFLILSASGHTQNCIYLANSVSEMDGTRLVITTPAVLDQNFANGKLQVYSSLYSEKSVILSFVILSDIDFKVTEGDSIILSLTSGDPLILTIFKQPVYSSKPEKKISFNVLLSAEDENTIMETEVDTITFRHNQLELTTTLAKKNQKRLIKNKVDCIASVR